MNFPFMKMCRSGIQTNTKVIVLSLLNFKKLTRLTQVTLILELGLLKMYSAVLDCKPYFIIVSFHTFVIYKVLNGMRALMQTVSDNV